VLVAAARGFAAGRLAAGGLAAHRLAATVTVAAALQPAAELGKRAAARTAARFAAGLAARGLAAGFGLATSGLGFAAGRLAAGGLTAGRLAARGLATRMTTVTAAADQAIEQFERLGARGAGNQRDAKHQGGEQDSSFHGDCSFKRVRESITDLAVRGRETNSCHSTDRANSCCGIVDARRIT
jgi:hypothetical protein